MSAHRRKKIRHKVVELLKGNTDAGDRVFATRRMPLRKTDLSAIAVYTPDEDAEIWSEAPRELARDVDIVVNVWARESKNVDDEIDDLCKQVEDAIHGDLYLGDTVEGRGAQMTGTRTVVDPEAEKPLGFAELTWSARYHTQVPEPPDDGDLDDFETAHVEYNVGGDVHEDDVAEDHIDVREDD